MFRFTLSLFLVLFIISPAMAQSINPDGIIMSSKTEETENTQSFGVETALKDAITSYEGPPIGWPYLYLAWPTEYQQSFLYIINSPDNPEIKFSSSSNTGGGATTVDPLFYWPDEDVFESSVLTNCKYSKEVDLYTYITGDFILAHTDSVGLIVFAWVPNLVNRDPAAYDRITDIEADQSGNIFITRQTRNRSRSALIVITPSPSVTSSFNREVNE